MVLAGVGYIVDTLLWFLLSGYNGQVSAYLMIPVFIAEFGLAGWLLLRNPLSATPKQDMATVY